MLFSSKTKGHWISKAFFLHFSINQKTNEILDKILPYEAGAKFVKYVFFVFFFPSNSWTIEGRYHEIHNVQVYEEEYHDQ